MTKIRIAIVGLGHWGQQYVRNFLTLRRVELVAMCDNKLDRLEETKARLQTNYDGLLTTQYQDLTALNLDAVVVATPASTHYSITKFFLNHDVHALVEKPLCLNKNDAGELVLLAKQKNLLLMMGHTLLFAQETVYLKKIIQQQDFGRLLSAHSQRLNLGKVHDDCNVIWDLAPHDISILLYLSESQVHKVHATAKAIKNRLQLDYASIQLDFENGMQAQLLLSWIEPRKTRRITLVGDHKHAVFDDCKRPSSLCIASAPHQEEEDPNVGPDVGELHTPELIQKENLQGLCEHFVRCILDQHPCLSPGEIGLEITYIIEAIHHSIAQDGAGVKVDQSAYHFIAEQPPKENLL